jgi:SAM-dependent methyltransferase
MARFPPPSREATALRRCATMANAPKVLDDDALRNVSATTVAHYERDPQGFWNATRDHDVSQNRDALLAALGQSERLSPPYRILDLGCGPGRDTAYFASLGHTAIGLDGCSSFVEMAHAHSGCEVWHQDFLALELPAANFDGVFANASLFHVPRQEIARVARELHASLRPRGVLFFSNPRAMEQEEHEGFRGDRYGLYMDLGGWRNVFDSTGFDEVEHFYRPTNKPRAEQPWLAMVWRRRD